MLQTFVSTEGEFLSCDLFFFFQVRWASPEILAASAAWAAPWSEKSDVWSFGCTVWQVFSFG
jgi:hypothetical protein